MVAPGGGFKRSTRRWTVAVGALAASALLATAAMAANGTLSGVTPPPEEASSPVAAPDSADVSSFAILRRSQSSLDQSAPAHEIQFSGASGANIALARRPAGFTGADVWVVPGRGTMCVLAESSDGLDGGAACTSDEAAAAGRLEMQTWNADEPGVVLVAGIVPDGVKSVDVQMADGSSKPLAVTEGVYAAQVQGTVSAVAVETASGTVTVGSSPQAVS